MKLRLLVIPLLLLLFACSTTLVSADGTFDADGKIVCGNENYTFADTMTFSYAFGNSDWVTFNNTDFNVTSSNPINISLSYLNSNILSASAGDTVLSFSANSTGGTVYFNLSGFSANQSYTVYRDDSKLQGLTSDADGIIRWTNDVWSSHDFVIKEGHNYVQVTYGRSALAEITPLSFDVLGMIGLIGLVIVGAAIIVYITRMGREF